MLEYFDSVCTEPKCTDKKNSSCFCYLFDWLFYWLNSSYMYWLQSQMPGLVLVLPVTGCDFAEVTQPLCTAGPSIVKWGWSLSLLHRVIEDCWTTDVNEAWAVWSRCWSLWNRCSAVDHCGRPFPRCFFLLRDWSCVSCGRFI